MKPLMVALAVLFAFAGLSAQKAAWQPSPGHTQMPIWPGAVPDARPVTEPETMATETKESVAGSPWVYVGKVSRPTMTVYSPKEKNTGAAVIVFPGGGYQILAIDLEGTEVCDWLTSRGITCVLLKYRVPGEGRYPNQNERDPQLQPAGWRVARSATLVLSGHFCAPKPGGNGSPSAHTAPSSKYSFFQIGTVFFRVSMIQRHASNAAPRCAEVPQSARWLRSRKPSQAMKDDGIANGKIANRTFRQLPKFLDRHVFVGFVVER